MFVPLAQVVERQAGPDRLARRRRGALRLLGAALAAVAAAVLLGVAVPRLLEDDEALARHHAMAPAPAAACHRLHTYRQGETLESIAAAELGAEWRAADIRMQNRALFDRLLVEDRSLAPGTVLELPGPCAGG